MKIRNTLLIIIILFTNQHLWAQYNGVLSEIYLGRQPSARTEAMGKSLDLFKADGNTSFFNPANLARLQGTALTTSYAEPYYLVEKAYYTNYGVATSLGEYGAVSLNRYNWNLGEKSTVVNTSGQILGTFETNETLYTLNYARPLMKKLYAGININLAQFRVNKTTNSWPVDLALTQYFDIMKKEELQAQVALGAAFFNIFKAKMKYEEKVSGISVENELPQFITLGLSGRLVYLGNSPFFGQDLFDVIVHIQYHNLYNASDHKAIQAGGELGLLQLLFLRLGYYKETLNTNGENSNEDMLDEITWGFGLQLPVNELGLFDWPLVVGFDYTKLEQPSYSKVYTDWDDFTVWNINIHMEFDIIDPDNNH